MKHCPIASAFWQLRYKSGMTLEQVAEAADCYHLIEVWKLENNQWLMSGWNRPHKKYRLIRIVEAMGFTLSDLMKEVKAG